MIFHNTDVTSVFSCFVHVDTWIGNPAMNVISYVQSEFRRKWSLVRVLWLAVYIKSVTNFYELIVRTSPYTTTCKLNFSVF